MTPNDKNDTFLAGWGFGSTTLDGKKIYEDYLMHFMLTQGMRDRDTLKVSYPLLNKKTPAGAVNPGVMQLDFYIRQKQPRPQSLRPLLCHGSDLEIAYPFH